MRQEACWPCERAIAALLSLDWQVEREWQKQCRDQKKNFRPDRVVGDDRTSQKLPDPA